MTKSEVDDHPFLGEEFLIWLWWRAETQGGLYAVNETERVGIALEKVLEFYDEATGVKVVVRGDAPTRAPEAREALSRGMRLARAGLIVTVDDENVSVVLDGPTFDLKSIKGPKPEGDSPEDRDASALSILFGLTEAIDRVYKMYLAERTADNFMRDTAPELLTWAKEATSGRERLATIRSNPRELAANDAPGANSEASHDSDDLDDDDDPEDSGESEGSEDSETEMAASAGE